MMNVGFTLRTTADDRATIQLHDPGAKTGRSLVDVATVEEDGLAAVLTGRLLYRDDLRRRVHRDFLIDVWTDAELALAAYRQHGSRGLELLEGEFSIAIVDAPRGAVFAARDPLGSWPLAFRVEPNAVVVGTCLRNLTPDVGASSIDPEFIASYLSFPFATQELPNERTAFKNVSRLSPGAIVEISFDGRVRWHREWDWAEQACDVDLDFEAAAERYREILKQAVAERIRGETVAAHLSGGLDSSSIVCLARDLLQEEGNGRRLTTLSLAFEAPELAGERAFIDAVFEGGGTLDATFLNGDSAKYFDWFNHEIPVHDEPYSGLYELSAQHLMADATRTSGATTVMTGIGVEFALEGVVFEIADLLRRGRLIAAYREARRWANGYNLSPLSVLATYGIKPALPCCFSDGIGPVVRRGYGSWPKLGLFTVPPWIHRRFAREHKMWQRSLAVARSANRYPLRTTFTQFGLRVAAAGFWPSLYLTAPHGIHTSHPFLDTRLLSFCLGMPSDYRETPEEGKRILRTAMADCLPEKIRHRKFKRGFDGVYGRGLADHVSRFDSMIRNSSVDELGAIDKKTFLDIFRQHAMGVGDALVSGRINRTLALIAWYDTLQAENNIRVAADRTVSVSAGPSRRRNHRSAPVESA